MLFNYQWDSNYDELKTFYPRFYLNVLEMQAILKTQGGALDEFMENVEKVFDNAFIDSMDEDTVASLEDFLNIHLYKQRTLEDRRKLLKTFFIGHGQLDAELIKQTVTAYTGDDVDVYLEPIASTPGAEYYEPGDNMLYINYLRGDEDVFYLNDIDTLLSRLIPAHLEYRSALTYRIGIYVAPRRKRYAKDFDPAGTIPDIATLGISAGGETVVNATEGLGERVSLSVAYKFCGTAVCHDGP